MAVTCFNSVEELTTFTAFREGTGGPADFGAALKQSVQEGTFALSQFQLALTQAREEIYARAGEQTNEEYETARAYQLKQAELYLATSRLYERFAEKVALKFPESNLAGVGSVQIGADTPSPLEKMETWHRIANQYRMRGEAILTGQGSGWSIAVGDSNTYNSYSSSYSYSNPYPCLSSGYYEQPCSCGACHHD